MNTCNVFFLFPGRFLFWFFGHCVPTRQRALPGKSPLSVLDPLRVILNFDFECQYFFLIFLGGYGLAANRGRLATGGVRPTGGRARLRSAGLPYPARLLDREFALMRLFR